MRVTINLRAESNYCADARGDCQFLHPTTERCRLFNVELDQAENAPGHRHGHKIMLRCEICHETFEP